MASTYLEKTSTGTNGNRKIWTISVWVKRTATSSQGCIASMGEATTDEGQFKFNSSDQITLLNDYPTRVSVNTSRLFRDTNAWYHLVWAHDTTETSNDDRWKLYVNGELIPASDYGSPTITLNSEGTFGEFNGMDFWVGDRAKSQNDNTHQYYDGLMAHFHYCDGYAYAASDFGETESTSGIWKPKTSPSVSYGTNGFFLKFQDSSSLGDDSSGNTNDLTLSGSGKQILDTPSNVFATWNFLSSPSNGNIGDITGSNGNLTTSSSSSLYRSYPATLGYSSGKWYWEIKQIDNANDVHLGICSEDLTPANQATWVGNTANGWVYAGDGGGTYNNGTETNTGYDTFTTNDIIQVAHDADNGKLYFGKNGTWQGSSDPAAGTNAAYTGLSTSKFWFPVFTAGGANSANFGNGYFGTTAIASAENDDAGYGKFEYDVPAGYYALCTKNINNYG